MYGDLPDHDEGTLTAFRSRATSGKTLAKLAKSIDLGSYLQVGAGEERSGGRERCSNLANALEAVIGGAYIDGGTKACNKIFDKLFVPMIEKFEHDVWAENPKGRLQEYCQSQWKRAPEYSVIGQKGPPHDTIFTVKVAIPDGSHENANGHSKQVAESKAAAIALKHVLSRDTSQG